MRFRNILLIVLCVAAVVGYYLFTRSLKPPSEAKVIASFNQHRAVYEQLRIMLLSDEKLGTVADWGVETTDSPIAEIPPQGAFPVGRFHEYLSLLKTVNAEAAARMPGAHPEARVLVWRSGFGGDTRHVAISWVDTAPANQTDSLDMFYRSPKPRQPIYKHIDGNWYIWADW